MIITPYNVFNVRVLKQYYYGATVTLCLSSNVLLVTEVIKSRFNVNQIFPQCCTETRDLKSAKLQKFAQKIVLSC